MSLLEHLLWTHITGPNESDYAFVMSLCCLVDELDQLHRLPVNNAVAVESEAIEIHLQIPR